MAFPPSSSGSDGRNASHVEMQPDAQHDGAPAGLTFSQSELPVVAVFNTPATLGGYSASNSNPARPTSEDNNVGQLPPTGLRR